MYKEMRGLYNFHMPKALYLRVISGPLTARYSNLPPLARRAGQLRRFLLDIQATLEKHVPSSEGLAKLELWVLSRKDWSHLTSRPYGIAFLRQQVIVAPAEYHPRLIERLDAPLLAAAQQGLKAPGEVRELFDLLIAYTWCKAVLKTLGYAQRKERAAHLLLLGLQAEETLLPKLWQWAEVLALSEFSGALKDLGDIAQLRQLKAPACAGLGSLPV